MADRITALRHALEKIALLASTSAAACNLAHEALYDDEQAQKAQDAAQIAYAEECWVEEVAHG